MAAADRRINFWRLVRSPIWTYDYRFGKQCHWLLLEGENILFCFHQLPMTVVMRAVRRFVARSLSMKAIINSVLLVVTQALSLSRLVMCDVKKQWCSSQ